MKKYYLITISVLLIGCTTSLNLPKEAGISPNHPQYTLVKIISRPDAKRNEIIPSNVNGYRRLAIVSNLLPYGIWEMGPDINGNIVTTNTVKNLSEWHDHKVTQKCIELGGEYIKEQMVAVNKNGLLKAIKLYEKSFIGLKYSRYNHNENYAVQSVIYAAGGNIRLP